MKSSQVAASINTHAPLCTERWEKTRERQRKTVSEDVFVSEEDRWEQRLLHNLHAFCVPLDVFQVKTAKAQL